MKNKYFLVVGLVLVGLLVFTNYGLAAQSPGSYRLGVQFSSLNSGVSGIAPLTEDVSLQGVISLGGNADLSGRVRYKMYEEYYWHMYGFGGAGLSLSGGDNLGMEAGAGIDYEWQGLDANLPPMAISIELGLVVSDVGDGNSASFNLGSGLHYNF